jgi:hypothetical protein
VGVTRSFKESPRLWILGILFLVVGIGLMFVAHEIEVTYPLPSEILRDVGIALCISVFIAALIEIGLARKMFENGLNAIMRQTVPEEVWEDIRQHVISQPIIRRKFQITMVIAENKDEYISTTTLDYDVESLRDVLTHHIHHDLDVHRTPQTLPPGRYKEIKVDGSSISLAKAISDDGLTAHFDMHFVKRAKIKHVFVEFKERVQVPADAITWWMPTPTSVVCVNVTVPQGIDVKVKAHHPEQELLDGNLATGWTFSGVMLPGQGLEIQLIQELVAPVPASSSAKSPTAAAS